MDDFVPATDYEYARIMDTLNRNKDKSFVQRILNPSKYPTLDMGDGRSATHRMEWAEAGGKYYVYPTVLLQEGGTLKDYGDSAWDQVKQTKNFIEFDNADDAEWFSSRYKAAWGAQKNRPPR